MRAPIQIMSFIVNKKLEYTLDDLMENISTPFPVFYGGPVEQDNLFFTHILGDLVPNSIQIDNNLSTPLFKQLMDQIKKELHFIIQLLFLPMFLLIIKKSFTL